MADMLRWWVAAELIGVAALPVAFRFFSVLPDRGIAFAKPLGLLLIGYVMWLGAYAGVLPYGGGSAALVLAALAVVGVWLAGRDQAALRDLLWQRRWYILAVEGVFLAFFIGVAVLRAYQPDIEATEKPFESAFFQSVLSSERFGPRDPWYGGEPMSYYYFGYVLVGVVTHLAGTAPTVAFNVGLALTGGMTAAAAYGVVYNLTAARGRLRPGMLLLAALLGPLFLLVVSNLEGVFEFLSIHGVSAPGFYNAIDIEGLREVKESATWYPTEHWWWWRATRLGSGWNVEEFPYFSFMLGDLHAHVMVLPYVLTTLAAVFNVVLAGGRLGGVYVVRNLWRVLGIALLAGGLYVTNAWDFPTALVVLGLITLALNYREASRFSIWPAVRGAFFLVPVFIFAILLYLPFYIGFSAAPTKVHLNEVLYTEVDRWAMATPPLQFLVFWGPLLFVSLSYLFWRSLKLRAWRLDSPLLTLALGVAVALPLLWFLLDAGSRGFGGLGDEVGARGVWLLTWYFVGLCIFMGALVFLREIAPDDGVPASAVHTFIAACMLTAFVLIAFPEFFFIDDIVVLSRHNTVFKFYYTAWLLLSVSGAAGVIDLLSYWQPVQWARGAAPRLISGGVWTAAALALLMAALVYPVMATMARTDGFTGSPTLDGLAGVRQTRPNEYDAALWLRANVAPDAVVLEAEGPEYSDAGRVSARTGRPTVIGWPNHEWQERGDLAPVMARVEDVKTIYTSDDSALLRELLARYNVRYIYVGDYERLRYQRDPGPIFSDVGRLVYQNPTVRIYAVGSEEPVTGAP